MTTTDLTLGDVLAQLNDYAADQVAELLHLAGKTGEMGEMHSCPIAMYLRDVLGVECAVDEDAAWLADDSRTYEPVELPDGVRAFVSAFDGYGYPDLITPSEYEDS